MLRPASNLFISLQHLNDKQCLHHAKDNADTAVGLARLRVVGQKQDNEQKVKAGSTCRSLRVCMLTIWRHTASWQTGWAAMWAQSKQWPPGAEHR
jgi:hypothetical protein